MALTSIWENDFYDTPPQPLWAFEVVFEQYPDLLVGENNTDITDQITLGKAVRTAKIGERKLNVIQTYFGGATFFHKARVDNQGNLTIQFNENENLTITSILNNLWNKTAMDQRWPEKTSSDDFWYRTGNANNKIIVKILKPNDNLQYAIQPDQPSGFEAKQKVSKIVEFYNCKLMTVDEVELDYSSEEVMTVNATWAYDYMKIIDPEPDEGETMQQTDNMGYA